MFEAIKAEKNEKLFWGLPFGEWYLSFFCFEGDQKEKHLAAKKAPKTHKQHQLLVGCHRKGAAPRGRPRPWFPSDCALRLPSMGASTASLLSSNLARATVRREGWVKRNQADIIE